MENKPVRRRPPRSLPLPANNDAAQAHDEKGSETVSTRKNRNSALIEKLQASLTLSPTGPPVFPKSPGVKLPVPSFSPVSPSSPSSPPVIVTPKQEETPATFESPADGTILKSINKGRPRLSIKRRPPSRRHRKSSTDEAGDETDKTASPTLEHTTPNGHEEHVFEEPKTMPDVETQSSKEQEEETKPDTAKAEPDETEEPVTADQKEGEEGEDKTEPEVKEEKSEDEPRSVSSTEEKCEEPITQPQTEPETTDKKEEEKEEGV